jgi:hypothetical protein
MADEKRRNMLNRLSSSLDVNGDGTIDHRDIAEAVRRTAKGAVSALDVNGDGAITRKDAVVASKIIGAAISGAGATAAASAMSGSAIVASGASAIAAKITAISGAAAGAFIAAILGPTTTTAIGIIQVGSSLLVCSSTTVTAVSAKLAALSASGGALAAQVANGTVAGLPVIKSMALSNAVAANQVVVVAGIPMGISAAIAAGLVAVIIVGGYAYYLLTKDRADDSEVMVAPA